MEKVRFAINAATNREMGVRTTTTRVIKGLTDSIKPRVPSMVITPVNSWVKPMSSPSENWSISAMIRLIMSPCWWESTYFRGSSSSRLKALVRISFTTR